MIREGEVLVCDEVDASMDSESRRDIQKILRESKSFKVKIFVSHNLEEFPDDVNHKIIFMDGRVIRDEKNLFC